MRRPAILAIAGAVLLGCPADDDEGPAPLFPEDYDGSYVEVRNCRGSGDHDLHNIRILADPAALAPYQDRDAPFPLDAIVLKEEYDFGDLDCSGDIVQWTVMQRLATGSAPDALDWHWQRVDAERRVQGTDEQRCISCHTACGVAPDGHDGTCAVP